MGTITHPDSTAVPAPILDCCAAGCTLSQTIACRLREVRRLRVDALLAGDGPDAEIVRADLAAGEAAIDRLITYARRAK